MLRVYVLSIVAFCAALTACSSGGTDSNEPDVPVPDPPQPDPSQPDPSVERLPINISSFVETDAEHVFKMGDRVGVFVVNHNETGEAVALAPSGNYVNNMLYTNTTQWTPATSTYWKDEKTAADFYLYYPYRGTVADACVMPFDVTADQSTATAYKAADLLVGSALNITPTSNAVKIQMKRVMSKVEIRLKAGSGFTDASLTSAVKGVRINSLKTSAVVNLSSGAVTAVGTVTDVIPYYSERVYRAVIVPQSIGERALISVNVSGDTYNQSKSCTFESGKNYTFVVTLNKTSSGINTAIEGWEEDGTDNGGIAEPM